MTRKNLVFFQSCTVFLSQLFVQMEFRALCVTLDQTCSAILSFSIFYMYKVNIPGNNIQQRHKATTVHKPCIFLWNMQRFIWNLERYYHNLILYKFKRSIWLPFPIYGVFRGGMSVTLVKHVLSFINLKMTCTYLNFDCIVLAYRMIMVIYNGYLIMIIYRMIKKFIETTIDPNQLANWFGSNFIFNHPDLFWSV